MAQGTGTVLIGGTVTSVHVRPHCLSFHARDDPAQAFDLRYDELTGMAIDEFPLLRLAVPGSDIEVEWATKQPEGAASHTKMHALIDQFCRRRAAGSSRARWPPPGARPYVPDGPPTAVGTVAMAGRHVILSAHNTALAVEDASGAVQGSSSGMGLYYSDILGVEADDDGVVSFDNAEGASFLRLAVRGMHATSNGAPDLIVMSWVEDPRNTGSIRDLAHRIEQRGHGARGPARPLAFCLAQLGAKRVTMDATIEGVSFREVGGVDDSFAIPFDDIADVAAHDGLRLCLQIGERETVVLDWMEAPTNTITPVELGRYVLTKLQETGLDRSAQRMGPPGGGAPAALLSTPRSMAFASGASGTGTGTGTFASGVDPLHRGSRPRGNATATATLRSVEGVEHIIQTYPTCVFLQEVGPFGEAFGVPYDALGDVRARGNTVELLVDGEWLAMDFVHHMRNTHDPDGLCVEIMNRRDAPPPSRVLRKLSSAFIRQGHEDRSSLRSIGRAVEAEIRTPVDARPAPAGGLGETVDAAALGTGGRVGSSRRIPIPLMPLDLHASSNASYTVAPAVQSAFWDNYANQAPPGALATHGGAGKLSLRSAHARGCLQDYLRRYPIQVVAAASVGGRRGKEAMPTTFMCGSDFLDSVEGALAQRRSGGHASAWGGDSITLTVFPPARKRTLTADAATWRRIVAAWNKKHTLVRKINVTSMDASGLGGPRTAAGGGDQSGYTDANRSRGPAFCVRGRASTTQPPPADIDAGAADESEYIPAMAVRSFDVSRSGLLRGQGAGEGDVSMDFSGVMAMDHTLPYSAADTSRATYAGARDPGRRPPVTTPSNTFQMPSNVVGPRAAGGGDASMLSIVSNAHDPLGQTVVALNNTARSRLRGASQPRVGVPHASLPRGEGAGVCDEAVPSTPYVVLPPQMPTVVPGAAHAASPVRPADMGHTVSPARGRGYPAASPVVLPPQHPTRPGWTGGVPGHAHSLPPPPASPHGGGSGTAYNTPPPPAASPAAAQPEDLLGVTPLQYTEHNAPDRTPFALHKHPRLPGRRW